VNTKRIRTIAVTSVLALALLAGGGVAVGWAAKTGRTHIVAYFDNTNGLFHGDEVRVLGVAVGAIDTIEPQPNRAKVSFWVDDKYKIPLDVKAAILSPQLVTSRAIQLTPPYSGGPVLSDGGVIPQDRTAVPVEWDDLRSQLQKLTDALQPTQPGGVSTLGALINTAAGNLRGQGANIRDSVIKLSQAFSVLGDHSDDIFSTIKHLSVLVSALHDSASLLSQLNRNLASVTALVADDPTAVADAVNNLNTAVGDATRFITENREALGTTTDKLSSITKAIYDSIDDIKQTLHTAPTAYQNFLNQYSPSHSSLNGAFVINNFASPISFLCGAIQAASRLNSEQAAKLCVQYLAPIIKNREYNFPPVGFQGALIPLFLGLPIGAVGEQARPNELTYSENWLRPSYVPPHPAPPPASPPTRAEAGTPAPNTVPPVEAGAGGPAEAPAATDPAAGLPGIMVHPGGGQ
jgi:phospholipid/cholesterol/gamma-HCH transport system substrate-binding protein